MTQQVNNAKRDAATHRARESQLKKELEKIKTELEQAKKVNRSPRKRRCDAETDPLKALFAENLKDASKQLELDKEIHRNLANAWRKGAPFFVAQHDVHRRCV